MEAAAATQMETPQEEIFRRLHELEKKVEYIERREQEGWRTALSQITQMVENSRNSTAVIGNLEIKLSKDVQFIEDSVARDIQTEVQRRAEAENRLRKAIAEEADLVKSALAAAEGSRATNVDARIGEMAAQYAQLVKSIDQRLDELKSQLADAIDAANQMAIKAEDSLSHHQAAREAAEMNLLNVLEETCVQLHQELIKERNERIDSEKRLERLLLEVSRRQWVRT